MKSLHFRISLSKGFFPGMLLLVFFGIQAMAQTQNELQVGASILKATCPDTPDGSIDLTVSGDGPFLFDWDDLPGTQDPEDRNGISPGQYYVTVTELSGDQQTVMESFFVDHNDSEPPLLICPGPVTLYTDAGCCANMPDYSQLASISDNCCIGYVIQSPPPGTPICGTGIHEVSIYVYDCAELPAFCTFTVELLDVTPPWIECPPPLVLPADPGGCEAGGLTFPARCLPPPGTAYDALQPVSFPNGTTISNLRLSTFGQCMTPPVEIGSTQTDNFYVDSFFDIFYDIGFPSEPGQASGQMVFRVTKTGEGSQTETFETEMLQLDLVGGGTGNTILLRESPTLPSLGQTTISQTGTGMYHIDSFFDIFTEISLDGGQSWIPSPAPVHMEMKITELSFGVSFYDDCSVILSATRSDAAPLSDPWPAGTTTIIWTATDENGNAGICTQTVTVIETEPPVVICPGPQVLPAGPQCCTNLPDYTSLVSGSDNCCEDITYYQMPEAGTELCGPGPHTVSIIAVDCNYNQSGCSFQVTLEDVTPPVISGCPGDITVYTGTAAQDCGAYASWDPPTAWDNCGSVTLTSTHEPGSYFYGDWPAGNGWETEVTYTATDGSGNSVTCTFKVIVVDNTPPVILDCPEPEITVYTSDGPGDCTAPFEFPLSLEATDNCGLTQLIDIETVAAIGNPPHGPTTYPNFPVGDWTITYTVTDGQDNLAYCTIQVHVIDNTPPVIICPDNQILESGVQCCALLPDYISLLSGSDNCCEDITYYQVPEAGTELCGPGPHTVNIIAVDCNYNQAGCSFQVTLEDKTPPVISGCPGDITVYTGTAAQDCGAYASWEPPTAWDNCGSVTLTSTHEPGSFFFGDWPVGNGWETEVTYTATDGSGNSVTCTFKVIVVDNTPPVITNCPSSERYYYTDAADEDCSIPTPNFSWQVYDNCGLSIVTSWTIEGGGFSGYPPAELPVGTYTFTVIASDDRLNETSCEYVVHVIDNTPPVVICPDNQILEAGFQCCALLPDYTSLLSGSDNCCEDITYYQVPEAGTELCGPGPHTVSIIAVDCNYNQSGCSFQVTLEDATPPVISGCPGDITVYTGTAAQDCGAYASWDPPTSWDNCGSVTLTSTHEPGSYFYGDWPAGNGWETEVTYTATDGSGNSITCTFKVIVVDNTPPVILDCPEPEITVYTSDGHGDCTAPYEFPLSLEATDNCGLTVLIDIETVDADNNPPPPGGTYGNFPVGDWTITYTVTDGQNNFAYCTIQIHVIDNTPPLITCPDNQTLVANAQSCATLPDYLSLVTVSDNCCEEVSYHQYPPAGAELCGPGDHTVTVYAADCNNNTSFCQFTVNLEIFDPLEIICPPPVIVNADPGQCSSDGHSFPERCFPPVSSQYLSEQWIDFPGTSIQLGNTVLSEIIQCLPPPFSPGVQQVNSTMLSFFFDIFTEIGGIPQPVQAPGAVTVRIAKTGEDGPSEYFETEMLQLDLQGGSFPSGLMIRESPTLPSLGQTSILDEGPGGFRIGSFFDIFTEISLDGGQSWNPASGSLHVRMTTQALPAGLSVSGGTGQHTITGLRSDGAPLPAPWPVGSTTVTWIVTDDAGNTASCTQTVTVIDNEPPVIDCTEDFVIYTGAGNTDCSGFASWDWPDVSDNCGWFTLNCSEDPAGTTFWGDWYSGPGWGSTEVYYMATDASGNTSTCSFTVTVIDDTPPVIHNCPSSDLVFYTAIDAVDCSIPTPELDWELSDNCGLAEVTSWTIAGEGYSGDPPSELPVGTYTFTVIASDDQGNQSSCSYVVHVLDGTPPQITCPPPVTLFTDPGLCSGDGHLFGERCLPPANSQFLNNQLNGFAGTDLHIANLCLYNPAPCTSPPTLTGQLQTSNFAVNSFFDIFVEIGAPAQPVHAAGTVTVHTTRILDEAGTEYFDTEMVQLDLQGGNLPSGMMIRESPTMPSPGHTTLKQVGSSGYMIDSFFDIFTEISLDGGQSWMPSVEPVHLRMTTTNPSFGVEYSDNCSATLSGIRSDGAPLPAPWPVGTTTVTWTVTDDAGNTASCTQTVTVTDNEPPVVGCPEDQVLVTGAQCCANLPDYTALVSGSDNCCEDITYYQVPEAGTELCGPGPHTVSIIAVDCNYNQSGCSFQVTLEDETPPVISGCPGDIMVYTGTAAQDCGAYASWNPPTAWDNCGSVTLTSTHEPGSYFYGDWPVGNGWETEVTYTATDGSGNSVTCTFKVIVVDNTPPVILDCPEPEITVYTSDGIGDCTAPYEFPLSMAASDNCGLTVLIDIETVGADNNPPPPGGTYGNFPVGDWTITYTVTDGQNNFAYCTIQVHVIDNTPPVIICPDNQALEPDAQCCAYLPDYIALVSGSDDCCEDITYYQVPEAGTEICNPGPYTVTITAVDCNDNEAGCSFNVTLNGGNHPPLANPGGPYVTTIDGSVTLDGSSSTDPDANCGDGITYAWDLDNDGFFDDAGVAMPVLNAPDLIALGPGTHPVVLQVTDMSGVSSVAGTSLTIYSYGLTASFTATPNPVGCHQAVTFNASASSHEDPARSIISYEWDFDYTASVFTTDATGVIVTHTFTDPGTYTVALRVTDDNVPPISGIVVMMITQNSLPDVVTVGTGGDYPTLTGDGGLFETINGLVLCHDLLVKIISNLSEPGTHALNQWLEDGYGPYTVTIIPDQPVLREVTGNVAVDLIRFNGADRVIIDGNSGGSGRFLLFRNLAGFNSTFTYWNDAKNHVVKNCIIEGGNRTPNGGVFLLSNGISTGNDNYLIQGNIFRNAGNNMPNNLFSSNSTSLQVNSGIEIEDNEFSNFRSSGVFVKGIGGGTAFRVEDNVFYCSIKQSTAQTVISFTPAATSSNIIRGNRIGGSNNTAGGAPWNNSGAVHFKGIYANAGTYIVENNLITNILLSHTATAHFTGIELSATQGGLSQVKTNVIGDAAVADAIQLAGKGNFTGILMNVGTIMPVQFVEGNIISNITNTSSGTGSAVYCGIKANKADLRKNRVFALNVNNINLNPTMYGIWFNGTQGVTNECSNNMISMGGGSVQNPVIYGIYEGSAANSSAKYYYNSVHIYGSASLLQRSYSFYRQNSVNVTIKNNIFSNFRSAVNMGQYAIYTVSGTYWSYCDYNVLYTASAPLCSWAGSDKATFANWKSSSGKDANSVNLMPLYFSNTDLHLLTSNVGIDGKGNPVVGYTTDIDGNPRSVYPDPGCDEFSAALPRIEQETPQNAANLNIYPNPFTLSTTLEVVLTEDQFVELSVYNLLGERLEVISSGVLYRGQHTFVLDAANLPSGMYICRMLVDRGELIIKRMELIR